MPSRSHPSWVSTPGLFLEIQIAENYEQAAELAKAMVAALQAIRALGYGQAGREAGVLAIAALIRVASIPISRSMPVDEMW